jgi:hypothetical protein
MRSSGMPSRALPRGQRRTTRDRPETERGALDVVHPGRALQPRRAWWSRGFACMSGPALETLVSDEREVRAAQGR